MRLWTRFLSLRAVLLKKHVVGDVCPRCKRAALLLRRDRRYAYTEEHYGGGYAHASSFRSGEPREHDYQVVEQIVCPNCGYRGRAVIVSCETEQEQA